MAKAVLNELKSMREWLELRGIRVKPEQRKFTNNLILSYLQSSHPAVTPYSISVNGTLIGYVLMVHAENPVQWIIERLTIDADYQRQGYGYDVADQLIDMIHDFENSEMVVVRYHPDNEAARQLAQKLKFEEQEKMLKNRNVALLEFEFEEVEELVEDDDEDYDDDVEDEEDLDEDDDTDDLEDDDEVVDDEIDDFDDDTESDNADKR